MALPARALLSLAVTIALACTLNAQTPAPNDDMANGIQAFKVGHFDEAIRSFEARLKADPADTTARLYLGTAYASSMLPDNDSPANVAAAHRAIDALQQVPATDARYPIALRQIAWMDRNIRDTGDARNTELQIIALKPGDAESRYTVGVIDWTDAYKFATHALAAEGLQDDGQGNTRMKPATCASIRTHNAPLIDEAVAQLRKAVELRPSYTDAMSYLNLVYRRRADLDCDDPAARKQDIAEADQWTMRSVSTRKQQGNIGSVPR